jgi:G:T-mismatch repair DNA endonuclease (very short patch repair protein)
MAFFQKTKEYKIKFNDEQVKVLEDSLLDIGQWGDTMWKEKISRCIERGSKRIKQELIQGGAKTLPVHDIDILKAAFKSKKYKNRKQRDEEDGDNRKKNK